MDVSDVASQDIFVRKVLLAVTTFEVLHLLMDHPEVELHGFTALQPLQACGALSCCYGAPVEKMYQDVAEVWKPSQLKTCQSAN